MAVKKRQKVLSHGRPPASKPKDRMSSQQSRTIIRTHHRLQKAQEVARKKGDTEAVDKISRAIEKNGGLKMYQAASKQGQSKDRGGDSSKVLVEWLQQAHVIPSKSKSQDVADSKNYPNRCLEVGALSTRNEISKLPNLIDVTRIDLNSQGPGIEKQDFMQRPLPKSDEDRFDIISLSLVLNYVPDAVGRGEMLKRVTRFLRKSKQAVNVHSALPALFLVLPLPCVDNSRYLDEKLLLRIMENLGFTVTNQKNTPKLCYYLFTLNEEGNGKQTEKKKINDGPARNNFCIVVK